jgi:hypothetical protein
MSTFKCGPDSGTDSGHYNLWEMIAIRVQTPKNGSGQEKKGASGDFRTTFILYESIFEAFWTEVKDRAF